MMTPAQFDRICARIKDRHNFARMTIDYDDVEVIAHEYAHILAFRHVYMVEDYIELDNYQLPNTVSDMVRELSSQSARDANEIAANAIVHVAFENWMYEYGNMAFDEVCDTCHINLAENSTRKWTLHDVKAAILARSTQPSIIRKANQLRDLLTTDLTKDESNG